LVLIGFRLLSCSDEPELIRPEPFITSWSGGIEGKKIFRDNNDRNDFLMFSMFSKRPGRDLNERMN